MPDTIIRKGQPIPELLNTYDTLYIEEHLVSYHMYQDSLRIALLDNALATGKTCPEYYISTKDFRGNRCDIFNLFTKLVGEFTIPAIKRYLQSLTFEADKYNNMSLDLDEAGMKVSLSYRDSNRMYSPFALERLKPLKEIPKKWNLTTVKRALANNQFRNLRCNGILTDDYAYDAAVNFRQGPLPALPLLEDLVTSPSGWWTSLDEKTGSVSICCHHFNSNSFILDLNPYPGTVPAETKVEQEAEALA
jgi:hypothetical protein